MTFTPDARRRLDDYLGQVRAALSGCRSVNADEVERDIREHIENEFQGATEPVSLAALDAVLVRLGSPGQWAPADEMSGWYRALVRFRDGPEDWRLAYLAFGLFLVGAAVGLTVSGPVALVLLGGGFLLARAALSVAHGRGEDLGAQRWLLYPALLPGYLGLLAVLFLWPAWVLENAILRTLGLWNAPFTGLEELALRTWGTEVVLAYAAIPALGLWWLVLGVMLWRRPPWRAAIFYPFAGRLQRLAPAVLFCASLGVVVLCLAVVVVFWLRSHPEVMS
jgi:hypothetical protein